MTNEVPGFGVCRTVGDAQQIAKQAEVDNLRGCYPSAAVVLNRALDRKEADYEALKRDSKGGFDYIAEAMVTRSDAWHGANVSFTSFIAVLAECIEGLKRLDTLKKGLFYGREVPANMSSFATAKSCQRLPEWFKDEKFGEYIMHAIIGAATETGELLQALYATVADGKPFDEVNMCEEAGDTLWYLAMLADTSGFSFEEAQRINIAKLRARYPDKFDAFNANNRNVEFERSILETVKKVEQTA